MIFESFSVILRQISLGVPTVRRRLFSLSYEKILQKSRFLGLCRNARSNVTRSTFVRRRSFSLSYEKLLQKSRFLGLCRNARSNVTRSTFARCCSFSLSYEKILQKSRLWVFSVILRQISLGVPTVRRHSFSDRATKCVTRFTFNTNFKLCHSSG